MNRATTPEQRFECRCKAGSRGVEVTIPSHIMSHLDRRSTKVDIDPCIVRVIESLWREHVVTLGCCCGHNNVDPSVILHTGESPEDVQRLLARVSPDRRWTIYQWRLMDVSRGGECF